MSLNENASSSLFRTQVLEKSGSRQYGSILLVRPTSFSVLTGTFIGIGAALIAFTVSFSVDRKAKVPGVLLPSEGLIRIIPSQGGVVTEMPVREGDRVKAGDLLFVLSNERASTKLNSAERTISALLEARRASFRSEQAQLRRQKFEHGVALQRRMSDLESEMRRIDDQILLQRRRIELVEAAVRRYEDLQASKFMPAVQVQEKQAELIDQQQRLTDLARARASVERSLADARYEASDLKLQLDREQESRNREIAAVEQELAENEARRRISVRAPRNGVLTAITAEQGQATIPGQAIAAIVPSGSELEAELYVMSRSVGFVRLGMPVLLRYQSYSYQKFGHAKGTVREISATAMRAAELNASGAAMVTLSDAEPVYRVRVRLDRQTVTTYGVPRALKPGALLDASIILERRPLYEWILDPLYTVFGRI